MFLVSSFFGNKGLDPKKIPQTKPEISKILTNSTQTTFISGKWGYRAYNLAQWLENNDIYEINYNLPLAYEPYYVCDRFVQLYDETFVTWGYDKVTQILDMNALGYKMKFLPDTFMIHLNHSDIKGFKSWSDKERPDDRSHLKVGTSVNRWSKLPGLLTNTYSPSWVKGGKEFVLCNDYFGMQKLTNLKDEIESTTHMLFMYKIFLYIFICVLFFLISVLVKRDPRKLKR